MTMVETEALPKGSGTRFIPCEEFQLRGEDGRSLEGMIVPYEQVADVVEQDPETNRLVTYREQFLKGSLAAMAQGFKARGLLDVPLLIGHSDTFQARIGYATSLHSRSDGAWASFRIYEDSNLVKIQSMLKESHTGLSIAFRDTRAPRLIDGIISRVQVFLGHVAATPVPTYAGAGITAIRSQDDSQEAPRPLLDDVRAWLATQQANGAQNET
jgi:HK97 family phage prohead protease